MLDHGVDRGEMKGMTVLVALLVVAGIVAIPAVGAAIQEDREDGADEVQNGDRIAGVMAVQEAELEGELERHSYENALDRADDNATKAAVIAERVEASEERLQTLEERKAALEEQRESGEISEGRYRVEIARLSAETNAAEGTLDRSEEAANGLPADVLEANGVNVTAIQELRENARELNGQEISKIARSITGDSPGQGPGEALADDRSDDRADNRSDDRAGDRPGGDGDAGDENAENAENTEDDDNGDEGDDGRSGDAGNSSTD